MFANMKLRTKLAATGVALLLPLIWVTYLLSDEMDIRINFGAQEILGVEYLNPLQNLLDQAGEYKVAVAANSSVTQIVSRLEKAMSALEKEQQRSGVALKTAEQYANLQKAWGQSRAKPGVTEADALIAATRELIAKAGDTSNLILDPDLDTYYVMDALLLKLPNSLDLLAQMREFGTGLMNSGSMSADDKTRMVVLSGLLQSDLDGVNYDSKVAYENNAVGDMPQSVAKAVDSYTQAIGGFLAFVEKNITGRSLNVDVNGFKSAAQRAVEGNMALYQQASPALKSMLQRRIDGFSSHKLGLLAGVIVFELLAIAFSVMTVRRILNQLGGEPEYAADIVRAIAAGDLTRQVKISDGDTTSLLAGIRNMQTALHDLIVKVSDSASKILSFSAEITQTTEAIVTSSSRQSHATATMSSAVQEVAASLHEMVASAGEARSLSLESNQRSSEGKDIVEQVSEDIRRLCDFVGDSAKSVQSLGQQSEQIYSIVNVIKGIAEQTNLLALNAAIEAARAGEQGRGFAVVADEVRNLAARTASSTVEITDMIQRIKDDTLAVVKRMDSGVEEASRSAGRVTLTVDTIAAISDLSESVNRSVTEISTALEQQAQANELLSENVDEIAQLAEQNHGSVEKTADNLSELKALADTLETAIASFKV